MLAVTLRAAQTEQQAGPGRPRSYRPIRLTTLTASLLVCALVMSTTGAAEPLVGERAEAAAKLTDPYRLGSKQHRDDPHPDGYDELVNSSDPDTAALGKLLVERKALRAKIEADIAKLQEYSANAVKKMQGALQGFLFRDVFGPERSFGDRFRDAAGSTREPVRDALVVQQELYQLGLKELKHEKEVRAKIRQLRAPLTATEGADEDFFVSFRLDPKRHELATISVKNRSQQALHHVLVLVELDCKYDLEHAKEELDGLGGAMLYTLGANLMQLPKEYGQRDKARVEYEDLDKGHYVYLETWNPSSTLEMDVQEALSLVKFTHSAKLTIVSDELAVIDMECPLDVGKRKLVTDLKAECARRNKTALAARKKSQKPTRKPSAKSASKRR